MEKEQRRVLIDPAVTLEDFVRAMFGSAVEPSSFTLAKLKKYQAEGTEFRIDSEDDTWIKCIELTNKEEYHYFPKRYMQDAPD